MASNQQPDSSENMIISSEKSIPQSQGEYPILASSLVEKDLSLSWDTIGAEYSWYRVESYCTPVDCESMGVDSNKCPSMTIVSTVVAQNLADLCESMSSPKVNPPMAAKILSVRRYSRSFIKQNNTPDQCNVLEDLDFCQIPECQEFCLDEGTNLLGEQDWPTKYSSKSLKFDGGFWERRASLPRPRKNESIVARSEDELGDPVGSLYLEGDSFNFDGSGGVGFYGASFVVSPVWLFEGSGAVSVYGSLFIHFDHDPSGGVSLLGSHLDLRTRFDYESHGFVAVHGSSSNASPSFVFSSGGSIQVSGSALSPTLDMGTFTIRGRADAFAFDMGYEYIEDLNSLPLSISDFSVSACGCQAIGPNLVLRHNLQRSSEFDRFLSSGGLSLPSLTPMRYRSGDSSWRFVERIYGRSSEWVLAASFECMSDTWRFDFSVGGNDKRTRIVLDIPSDIVCYENMRPISMAIYFASFSSNIGAGERIPATTPVRSNSLKVYGKLDPFVNGIFVPGALYYDGLGLFADSYWSYAPLELDINPPSKSGASLVDLSWVI